MLHTIGRKSRKRSDIFYEYKDKDTLYGSSAVSQSPCEGAESELCKDAFRSVCGTGRRAFLSASISIRAFGLSECKAGAAYGCICLYSRGGNAPFGDSRDADLRPRRRAAFSVRRTGRFQRGGTKLRHNSRQAACRRRDK